MSPGFPFAGIHWPALSYLPEFCSDFMSFTERGMCAMCKLEPASSESVLVRC